MAASIQFLPLSAGKFVRLVLQFYNVAYVKNSLFLDPNAGKWGQHFAIRTESNLNPAIEWGHHTHLTLKSKLSQAAVVDGTKIQSKIIFSIILQQCQWAAA